MRKIIHIATTVLLSITTACSSDEEMVTPSPESYIYFGVPTMSFDTEIHSRAILATEITDIKVWGYCVPRNPAGNANDITVAPNEWVDKSFFFTNGADVFNGNVLRSDNNFSYTPLKPWNETNKNNGRYAFIATSPSSDLWTMSNAVYSQTSENTVKQGPQLTFTMPASVIGNRPLITDQNQSTTNIISPAQVPDAMIATRFDHSNSNGIVNLNFSHFLTGLRFQFHNYSGKNLEITGMTIHGNFYKSAKFDFTSDKTVMSVDNIDSNKFSANFNLLTAAQTIAANSPEYLLKDPEGNADDINNHVILLLIANPAAEGDENILSLGDHKKITINYSIDGVAKTFELANDKLHLSYQPQPNTLHTAHFNFIGDSFAVFFQSDDDKNWENGSDAEHEIK